MKSSAVAGGSFAATLQFEKLEMLIDLTQQNRRWTLGPLVLRGLSAKLTGGVPYHWRHTPSTASRSPSPVGEARAVLSQADKH